MSREVGSSDVPNALRAAGAQVETHDGNFAPDAPDDQWIREVGRRGWLVLSKDEKIRAKVFRNGTVKMWERPRR